MAQALYCLQLPQQPLLLRPQQLLRRLNWLVVCSCNHRRISVCYFLGFLPKLKSNDSDWLLTIVFTFILDFAWKSCGSNTDCGNNGLVCSTQKVCVCPAYGKAFFQLKHTKVKSQILLNFKGNFMQTCTTSCFSNSLQCIAGVCLSTWTIHYGSILSNSL